ncbi:type I methionyl aminopeptidase [Candidatus Woesebacteria bacterium RIFCSPLOWO2_12_FULL_42_8]|nr:MAG: type I methionyl aminopeptidase [Candidatus Woesebacteria bacterium RIFCSPLOWO2_12_FULL_42_8]
MSAKVNVKTVADIEKMRQGGKKLAEIRRSLESAIKPGIAASEIDALADKLIEKAGCKPSFKMVSGYCWSTCVNVNEGVVHVIPKKEIVFADGDLVSVDVGVYYRGYHTDTSTSVIAGKAKNGQLSFLATGRNALKKGILAARIGNKVGDISEAIESSLKKANLSPIRALVGHGIGKELHEAPYIPCFVSNSLDESLKIKEGWTLAIEVMYTQGKPDLVLEEDNWTIRTKDAKISGLFEETVAVIQNGPIILTK